MIISKHQAAQLNIRLNGQILEQVNNYKYLQHNVFFTKLKSYITKQGNVLSHAFCSLRRNLEGPSYLALLKVISAKFLPTFA